MDLLTLIDVRPGVRGEKPSFVGTRITVYDVLEYLAGGMSMDDSDTRRAPVIGPRTWGWQW